MRSLAAKIPDPLMQPPLVRLSSQLACQLACLSRMVFFYPTHTIRKSA